MKVTGKYFDVVRECVMQICFSLIMYDALVASFKIIIIIIGP